MDGITVYALRFQNGELYVGMTCSLTRRIQEHHRRQSPSTKRFSGSFEILYTRAFETYAEARRHEKFLKSGAGRALLRSSDRA